MLAPYSYYASEAELLLPAFSRFKVTSLGPSAGVQWFVKMDCIGVDPDLCQYFFVDLFISLLLTQYLSFAPKISLAEVQPTNTSVVDIEHLCAKAFAGGIFKEFCASRSSRSSRFSRFSRFLAFLAFLAFLVSLVSCTRRSHEFDY